MQWAQTLFSNLEFWRVPGSTVPGLFEKSAPNEIGNLRIKLRNPHSYLRTGSDLRKTLTVRPAAFEAGNQVVPIALFQRSMKRL